MVLSTRWRMRVLVCDRRPNKVLWTQGLPVSTRKMVTMVLDTTTEDSGGGRKTLVLYRVNADSGLMGEIPRE
jgi:hypothetical protein